MNRITYDVTTIERDVAGRTVADVRRDLADRLNIAPNARAHVDGMEVSDSHVFTAEQTVKFVKPAGEKG